MSLIRFISKKFRQISSPRQDHAAVFNEALTAYVHTFPQRERLIAYISQNKQKEHATEIEVAVTTAVKNTEDYLYAQPNGVMWSREFEDALFNHVSKRSPWLSRHSFCSLISFGKWLCWHDGLNA